AERDAVLTSLRLARHNVSRAARELGVSRVTLYRLMEKHALRLDTTEAGA
ncbi:MAG TPA: helix-turn-helix domain-containing protein, partial [Gammaproteobacteria bacterium]|nr:helix-turn-helix domain-containing protein [Gammaproteobacteria bacterium]